MSTPSTVQWDSYTTFICSALSIVGSVIVLCSYMVAQSHVTPRAAQLIRNLAIADFFWFLAGLTQSIYWVFLDTDVPAELCYVFSPLTNFMRMASLIWTCAISFDVLMSVNKRKWLWVSEAAGKNSWTFYRRVYYLVILIFALPGCILNIIKQHNDDANLGCNPGYEKIGDAWSVFFTELLPISVGFLSNIYVYVQVSEKMTQKAFPQSVRKRRRRIMYHYIIVCIICWTPTMIFYLSEISGLHFAFLEIIARSSLYLTGFFNFLVFGMQDPHLKRAFTTIMTSMGCCCCTLLVGESIPSGLKTRDVDKTVMFGGHIEDNADVAKDKKNIYRYHKLTNEDKLVLYHDRPDLDPKVDMSGKKKSRTKNRSIDFIQVQGVRDFENDEDEKKDDISEPLLTEDEKRAIFNDSYTNDAMQSQHDDSYNSQGSSEHSIDNILLAFDGTGNGNSNSNGNGATAKAKESDSPKSKDTIFKAGGSVGEIPNTFSAKDDGEEDANSTELEVLATGVEAIDDIETGTATAKVRALSSEERITAARNRMKQLRLGVNGPLISDEESLANALASISFNRTDTNNSGNYSSPRTNGMDSPESSGDEADEEDHALAETLGEISPLGSIVSASSATGYLLGSP